jgi:hypothetical protein
MDLYGTITLEIGNEIVVDENQNVYILGYTYGNLDGQLNAGASDVFVTGYTSSGLRLWTRLFGSSGSDFGSAVDADPLGNIFATGNTTTGLSGIPGAGLSDVFVWKQMIAGQ